LSACSFNNPKAGCNAAGFFVGMTFDLGLRLRVEAASFAFPEDVEQDLTRSSEQAGNQRSPGFTHSLFGSSRIHKTNPVEPPISRNIAHLISLSARAMQTREEMFHD
jgi:hypothetical protein